MCNRTQSGRVAKWAIAANHASKFQKFTTIDDGARCLIEDTAQAMNRIGDDDALTAHDVHNDGNRAGRSVGLTQPSLTTCTPGDSPLLPTSMTSRLQSHYSDNDDATLTPCSITESGERSLLMPARRTEAETTAFEGNGEAFRDRATTDESLWKNKSTQKINTIVLFK